MNKKVLQIAGAGTLALALVFGLSALIERDRISQTSPNTEVPRQTINVSLTIDNLYTKDQVRAKSEDTVLEVLQSLNGEDQSLLLVTKEYSGLGVLVESMGGKTNGADDKYWQYFVNGTMAQIGADKLELKDGDYVEWRFEKPKPYE
jgi:hypothetical protein